jgi:hypothetical protein
MRRLTTMAMLAAVLLAAGSGGTASGATPPPISIGVAPSKLQANLHPGQLYKTDLDIYNKGDGPVVLDVFLQDYTISTESAVVFRPAGSLAQSAAPWSSLTRRVLHMPAHSHRRVLLTVDVPHDAAIGTHTLAVVFRSREVKSNGNVQYRPAVASLMAAGVENADGTGLVLRGQVVTRSVAVHWISLKDVWHSSDKVGAAVDWLVHPTVTANVEVRNTGNTFFNIIKGGTDFTTTFAAGDRTHRVAAPTYTILPNSVRTLTMSWDHAPLFARGSAETRIYYNATSHLPVETTPFMIIPWHLIIVVSLVLAVLVLWAVRRRARRGGGRRMRRQKASAPSPWLSPGAGV